MPGTVQGVITAGNCTSDRLQVLETELVLYMDGYSSPLIVDMVVGKDSLYNLTINED